ncbi:hypothetical protein ABEB36_010021 [Hypothenemus hampei]|uniref:Uncharacterized protein n=1 Tax=Hypothenemus hampei TaxID=57062 RepID=A0ABD1EIW1_HYPHA
MGDRLQNYFRTVRANKKFCPESYENSEGRDRSVQPNGGSITIYVHYSYTKILHTRIEEVLKTVKQNFLFDFYSHLQKDKTTKTHNNFIKRDEDYSKKVRQEDLDLYDGKLRSYKSATKQYETIWNVEKNELFTENSSSDVSPKIAGFLKKFGFKPDTKFVLKELEKRRQWWSLVPFSHKLTCWFAKKGKRLFAVFPVFKPGRKHIRCSVSILWELLRAWKILKKIVSQDTFSATSPRYWWKYFTYLKDSYFGTPEETNEGIKLTNNGRMIFAILFIKNGVDYSLLINRKRPTTTPNP